MRQPPFDPRPPVRSPGDGDQGSSGAGWAVGSAGAAAGGGGRGSISPDGSYVTRGVGSADPEGFVYGNVAPAPPGRNGAASAGMPVPSFGGARSPEVQGQMYYGGGGGGGAAQRADSIGVPEMTEQQRIRAESLRAKLEKLAMESRSEDSPSRQGAGGHFGTGILPVPAPVPLPQGWLRTSDDDPADGGGAA